MDEKNSVGRPSVMTEEMNAEICRRLAGGESLRGICELEGMPSVSTVLMAVVTDRNNFRSSYMQAREAAGFAHGDRIINVIDKVCSGELEPNSAKVMIDGLKWAAERMAPKVHTTRTEQTQVQVAVTHEEWLDSLK